MLVLRLLNCKRSLGDVGVCRGIFGTLSLTDNVFLACINCAHKPNNAIVLLYSYKDFVVYYLASNSALVH